MYIVRHRIVRYLSLMEDDRAHIHRLLCIFSSIEDDQLKDIPGDTLKRVALLVDTGIATFENCDGMPHIDVNRDSCVAFFDADFKYFIGN